MPSYTQSQLLSDVNGKIKGKAGILIDPQSTLNQGVRQVFMDLDLVSSRRRTQLTPNLFSGLFEYAAPTDLKGYGVITVQNQFWTKTPFWKLVPYEEFMRRQEYETLAISDYDFIRKLYIKASNTNKNDIKTTLSNLDTITSGGGTWEAFGDAINVEANSNNYVQGSGSIQFDISAAAGTTAGIFNSSLNFSDLSGYFQGDGSIIVWAYITSTTNLTNFIIRIGSSSGDYYTKTVTAQSDGTAFVNGWNLLNFNMATFTTVGTPVDTAIDYCALYFTKTDAKINEVGYRFDSIIFRKGEINNLYYYSEYGWQSASGTYKENSTTSSDLLNAGPEEYELIKCKCAELAADEVDEDKVSEREGARYEKLKKAYKMDHPSESLIQISTVATFIKV